MDFEWAKEIIDLCEREGYELPHAYRIVDQGESYISILCNGVYTNDQLRGCAGHGFIVRKKQQAAPDVELWSHVTEAAGPKQVEDLEDAVSPPQMICPNTDTCYESEGCFNAVPHYKNEFCDEVGSCFKCVPYHEPKPPLGLKPKYIHDEERLKEIDAAIERLKDAGAPVNMSWLDERDQLKADMRTRELIKAGYEPKPDKTSPLYVQDGKVCYKDENDDFVQVWVSITGCGEIVV